MHADMGNVQRRTLVQGVPTQIDSANAQATQIEPSRNPPTVDGTSAYQAKHKPVSIYITCLQNSWSTGNAHADVHS